VPFRFDMINHGTGSLIVRPECRMPSDLLRSTADLRCVRGLLSTLRGTFRRAIGARLNVAGSCRDIMKLSRPGQVANQGKEFWPEIKLNLDASEGSTLSS
jgi:hypothetical protein